MSSRVYVDNAATSWPKPAAVVEAVASYLTDCGAPAGRSGYADALEVDHKIESTRRHLAKTLGVADPRCLAFSANGTDALNQAMFGTLHPGDRVITSVAEHNSVLRPLRYLEETRDVQVERCRCGDDGRLDMDAFEKSLSNPTQLVVLTHASNVTGVVQPIREAIDMAHTHGALVLMDAAQSVGHLPIHVGALDVDMMAAPTHKGLLSPSGLGFLYVRPSLHEQWQFSRCGGTGTFSDDDTQPRHMPSMLEVGSPNVAAIVGLKAALEYLEGEDVDAIARHESRWGRLVHERLAEIPEVSWVSPWHADNLAVISFQVNGFDPQEFAAMLDAMGRVQVRAGFHCAPRMHRQLGTAASGGTVRISGGPFNSTEQVDTIVSTIQLAASMS